MKNQTDNQTATAAPEAPTYPAHCQHCGRSIILRNGLWIDPQANGDDEIWKETCDAHDTFTAEHEPKSEVKP